MLPKFVEQLIYLTLNYTWKACDDLVTNGSKRLVVVHQNTKSMRKNFDFLLTELTGWEEWPLIIVFPPKFGLAKLRVISIN